MWTPETGDSLDALGLAQFRAAYEQSGVTDGGCAVTLPTDYRDTLDVDVSSGTVLVAGDAYNVGASTVTLPSNSSTVPRKDVVYVDSAGALQSAQGTAAPEEPDPDPDGDGINERSPRKSYSPAPPALEDVLPAACVLAIINIPGGATRSDQLESDDIIDRRLPLIQMGGLTQAEADSRYLQGDGDGIQPASLQLLADSTTGTNNTPQITFEDTYGDSQNTAMLSLNPEVGGNNYYGDFGVTIRDEFGNVLSRFWLQDAGPFHVSDWAYVNSTTPVVANGDGHEMTLYDGDSAPADTKGSDGDWFVEY